MKCCSSPLANSRAGEPQGCSCPPAREVGMQQPGVPSLTGDSGSRGWVSLPAHDPRLWGTPVGVEGRWGGQGAGTLCCHYCLQLTWKQGKPMYHSCAAPDGGDGEDAAAWGSGSLLPPFPPHFPCWPEGSSWWVQLFGGLGRDGIMASVGYPALPAAPAPFRPPGCLKQSRRKDGEGGGSSDVTLGASAAHSPWLMGDRSSPSASPTPGSAGTSNGWVLLFLICSSLGAPGCPISA